MSVTLKRIQHAKNLSQETNAFTADVYWQGVLAGYAENHGTGGMTNVRIINRETEAAMDAWAKAQPPHITEGHDDLPMTLDFYIDLLVEADLNRKENQRLCRGHLVFRVKGDRDGDFRMVKATPDNIDKARAWAITKYGEQIDYFLNDRIGVRA